MAQVIKEYEKKDWRILMEKNLESWVLDCVDLFLKKHPNIPNFWEYRLNSNFYSPLHEYGISFPNPFNCFTWAYTKEGREFWWNVSHNEWLPFMITYLLKKTEIQMADRQMFRKYYLEYFGESSLEV